MVGLLSFKCRDNIVEKTLKLGPPQAPPWKKSGYLGIPRPFTPLGSATYDYAATFLGMSNCIIYFKFLECADFKNLSIIKNEFFLKYYSFISWEYSRRFEITAENTAVLGRLESVTRLESTRVATKNDSTRVVARNDSDSTRDSTLVTRDSTRDSTITTRTRVSTRITCWQSNYFPIETEWRPKKIPPRPQSHFGNPWPSTFVAIRDSRLDSSLYVHWLDLTRVCSANWLDLTRVVAQKTRTRDSTPLTQDSIRTRLSATRSQHWNTADGSKVSDFQKFMPSMSAKNN